MQTTSAPGIHATINVTPMIDVLLVLLIIFIAIAPQKPHGLPASVPQNAQTVTKDEPPILVAIASDRSIRVNSRLVSRADFPDLMRRTFESRSDRSFFLHGSRDLLFSDIASVIDDARGAGADRIGLDTGHP